MHTYSRDIPLSLIKKNLIAIAIAACTATSAHAAISSGDLIAIGSLTGSSAGANADLSGLTGTLENGAAANLLGGMGSGIAWAGGNTFIATPDRGPNAVAYNSLIDDTTSYIARFQTISMSLSQTPSGLLPFTLAPTLTNTTLLSSATALSYGSGALGTDATHTLGSGVPALNAVNNTNYFTGRSDGFATGLSTNPNNARLDPEGVRVSNDGKSVFVSDEYGPYVYQFDRATGQRINSFALPTNLAVATPGPTTTSEGAPTNTSGRVANKGMEGLAITPDGKTLVGVMQAPLLQDTNKSVRIVTIDIASGQTHEYAVQLTTGSGISEIVAINDHEFLIDERDGKGLGDGSSAAVKQLFKIDLTGAQDVTGLSGDLSSKAVSKTLFLDVKAALNAKGISNTNVPAKIEGMAWGEDVTIDGLLMHTLWVSNDNDFVSNVAGPNNFYVFAISPDALSSYQAQQISSVPLPGALPLLMSAIGLIGGAARMRRKK
ncbi:MAG TPA: esterase-like activity of phytase family protein [Spongiibacteraceae bacterium]